MSNQNRFTLTLQPGASAEETGRRTMQELISLVAQLNAVGIPIVVGPNDRLPEGMNVGQIVIDWSSGTPITKVWNGVTLA